jgi:glycosyltransferase involved in cell wall biosynthesis
MGTNEFFHEYNPIPRYIKSSGYIIQEMFSNVDVDSNLFRNLKLYESKVLMTEEVRFDLREIKQIFLGFLPKERTIKHDSSWNGFITHREFLAILNLVLTSNKITLELFNISSRMQFVTYCVENQRKCLIVSDWGFPFGGAEAFFEETALLLFELGFEVEWAIFQIPGEGSFRQNKIVSKDFYTEYQFSDYPDKFILTQIVKKQAPQILFSHGPMNSFLAEISEELEVIFIEGFHFWTGLVTLNNSSNMDILENIQKHTLSNRVNSIRKQGSRRYLVSEFMKEVYLALGGDEEFEVIQPLTGTTFSERCKSKSRGFVSQLDVSVGKGGHIFCDLVEKLGDRVPFLAVVRDTTENEVKDRLNYLAIRFDNLVLVHYSELSSILEKTMLVIVPSLVDETYSRITFEAVAFGIPVFTSANGNLERILDGVGAIPEMESIEWARNISHIYDDPSAAQSLWKRQSEIISAKSERNILRIILDAIDNFKIERVGVFSVNAPQGLGTLAKVLSNEFQSSGFNTYIFAFCPYNKNLIISDYWSDLKFFASDQIYISSFTRENVPISEILEFVDKNCLDVFIFPEMCWIENWMRLIELHQLRPNLRIVTIPMLETVIRNEVQFMNQFDLTLFPTKQSQSVLEKLEVTNGYFVGFTSPLEEIFDQNFSEIELSVSEEKIGFLHIAGHSPNVRKNTLTIIREFSRALEKRKDITLTLSLQVIPQEIAALTLATEVKIIKRALSDLDIAELYKSHDVSIQIPTHEGIGIGFYESTSLGVPVITLNREPHNEIITSDFTGWLLPATPFELPDNSQGVVNAGKLEFDSLADFLVKLSFQEVTEVKLRTREFYLENYSNIIFKTHLLSSLGSKKMISPKQRSVAMKPSEIRYHKAFNKFFGFCRRYLIKVTPLSINQKHKIKQFVLFIDQKISNRLK